MTDIPQELRDYDQWILWKFKQVPTGLTKVPCLRDGTPASVKDPASWLSYAEALDYFDGEIPDSPVANGHPCGIGFCFTEDDPFFGVDLDDCLPLLTGDALIIADLLQTYAEVSPSGNGIKFIGKGSKPTGAKSATLAVAGFKKLEVYDHDRFFTITGSAYGLETEIVTLQDELTWLCDEYLAADDAPATSTRTVEGASSLLERASGFEGNDDALIELLLEDPKYAALWHGDMGDYSGDQSVADLALLEKIAWLAGPVPDRIERIFSQSMLADRAKWDRQDYRDRSIAKALEGKTDFYNGPGPLRLTAADLPTDENETREGGVEMAPLLDDAIEPQGRQQPNTIPSGSPSVASFPIPQRGIIRDVVDLVGPLTESPDATIALGTLVMLSAVAGWGRVSKWGESEEPCILYACICGPSASGRKTTGLRNVEAIFHEAFDKKELMLENVGHASGRALLEIAIGGIDIFYKKLKEPTVPQIIELEDGSVVQSPEWAEYDDLKAKQEDKLQNPPSVVLVWDEMAKLLSVDGDWQRDTRTELLRMYNGKHSGIRTTGKDGLKVPGGKCQMGFLGTMVTADLERGLNSHQANDGFVGRILFSPDSDERKPNFAFPPEPGIDYERRKEVIRQKLVRFRERCETVKSVFPTAARPAMEWTPDAVAARQRWYDAGKETTGMELMLFDRVQATAAKIACLLALADDSDVIELYHVELAQQMADTSIKVSLDAVEKAIESQRDRYCDAVYTALAHGPIRLGKILERGMLGAAESGERLPERELRQIWISKDPRLALVGGEKGKGFRVERATE